MARFACTLSILLLFATTALPLNAQQRPEDVAQAYVQAIRERGVAASPEFIHPDELAKFKDMLLPLMVDDDSPVGDGLRRVAFGEGFTADAVRAMDDAAFMAGFLDGVLGKQMESMGVALGEAQVIGAVREGELVHLVTRNKVDAPGLKMTSLEVISLKPYQDSWKLMLSGEMEGLAQAIKSRADAARAGAGVGGSSDGRDAPPADEDDDAGIEGDAGAGEADGEG